jgi:hypothetical protein
MEPAQQSAETVHESPDGTQIGPPSGVVRQRSCPLASGTHGAPLQQSPENAQVSPSARQLLARQRGTPKASS